MTDDTLTAISRLVASLRSRGPALVAFSGGVDSAAVAALAHRAWPGEALAVTARAESLATAELEVARRVAVEIGIRHEEVAVSELAVPGYAENRRDRCYLCQGLRMGAMRRYADARGLEVVLDGTQADDPGPDRPGLVAVREQGVESPLLEHGLGKAAVRELARGLGLSVWDRPSNACLSSRVPRGQRVTAEKLRRIEAAERVVAEAGFRTVRVRLDDGEGRVEVGVHEVPALAAAWSELEPRLLALGFRSLTWDPDGYRQGGADRPRSAAPRPGARLVRLGGRST